MRLWVLEDNPIRGFYEHMGGKVIGQSTITLGKELTEIRYSFQLITHNSRLQ
jgi:hypothetical protein